MFTRFAAVTAPVRAIAAAIAFAIAIGAGGARVSAQQVVAGQNVNMVGGPWSFDRSTGKIQGDPFLQRQNEPSLAVSSRNPCHLLAGANDYRTVDVPGAMGDQETGDAWLGLYKSIDCGQTWRSTLLPGYPSDQSPEGLASPLKGLAAGADATVRPGPGGMIYFSGLAFNRGANDVGKVFVSRFIDRNNKEQGDPFVFLGTTVVDVGTSGQFLDKPWIAADIPRNGETCTVNGEQVPGGPVYLVYTNFVGGTSNPRSKIMFSRSTDCGATWSNPSKLSERFALNQGTSVAVGPDGAINVAWREFANSSSSTSANRILFARSTDGGKSFSKAIAIENNLVPFDQGASVAPLGFRTNAYPTMTVGGDGRIYVAWAARGFARDASGAATSDARIVMATSLDGVSWTLPVSAVDNYPGRGHQIMPALAFSAGKLALVYYDFRFDLAGVLNPSRFGTYVVGSGHTVDIRGAMANPAAVPVFADYTAVSSLDGSTEPANPSAPVSRYAFGYFHRSGAGDAWPPGAGSPLVQLQYNPPNLPIFAQGTTPFIGDYIDVAGQQFIVDSATGQWRFNLTRSASGLPVPNFHAAWADNRDVRRATVSSPAVPNPWANYAAPTIDPTNAAVCDPGINPGSRNQNVYTSTLTPGLVVSAPGNQKTVNRTLGIQRAYVVFVRNATGQPRTYMLGLSPAPAGSYASFKPIDESQIPSGNVTLTPTLGPIVIPAKSSISRTVFMVAKSGAAFPSITVSASEISAGVSGAVTVLDVAAVVMNPDISNPDISNPDISNPDISNPNISNPDISNAEVYNPDISNPNISNPDISNPNISNPDISNPDISNPDISNLSVTNPDISNPDISNPDISNASIANPDISNPDISNPNISNPDISNMSVTDVTWPVRNTGNATAAYAFKAKLNTKLPDGAKWQLLVHRVYVAPNVDALGRCAPAVQNQVLVNIPQPQLDGNILASVDPNEYLNNASFFLQPGDEGRVTLRVFCPKGAAGCPTSQSDAKQLASARVEAQAPNNCPAGSTNPNCAVNQIRPDAIYDVSPPTTSCQVTYNGTSRDCGSGPFVFGGAATFSLVATDGTGVRSTTCTVNGAACSASTMSLPIDGTYTVAYFSTDYAGNMEAPHTFQVQIDTAPPVVTGIAFPAVTNPSGWTSAASVTGTVMASDSSALTVTCADRTDGSGGVTVSGLTITVAGDGTHALTCAVTDAAGNSTSASALVRLDTGSPTVSAPTAAIVAEASAPGGATVTYSVTASDRFSGATVTCTPAGPAYPVGTTIVTCTAVDGAGNTSAAQFAVTVVDTTAPVVTPPANVTAEAAGLQTAVVLGTATATDAVGVVSLTSNAPATFPIGVTVVTWTAADAAGNAGTATQTVVVRDTTPPVVTPPANVTAEATGLQTAVAVGSATATDAVGVVSLTSNAPAKFPVGTTIITWTATDAAGNAGTATQKVTVGDTTAPVVTPPANVTAEATGLQTAVAIGSATATDAVGVVSLTSNAPATFPVGTTLVTWTAKDAAGNAGTATQTIVVRDTTPPVVTPPANVTAEATGLQTAVAIGSATATDAVGVVTITNNAPAAFPVGVTSVTWTAVDGAGNTSTATQLVTVRDTTAPAVTAPPSVTAEATGALTVVAIGTATAADAVGVVTITNNAPAAFPVGTTIVTWTATDSAGNAGTAVQSVVVRDSRPPVLSLPADMAVEASSSTGATVAYVVTAADIVDPAPTVSCVPASGRVFPIGTTTVSCTATDRSGNSSSGSFRITVSDTKPPVITMSVTPALIWSPNAAMVPVTVSGTITDAGRGVGAASYAVTDEYGQIQPSGSITVAADGSFSFSVSLQASRKGSDKNGRLYTITVTATDRGGLKTVTSAQVVAVEHDQSK